MGILAVILLSPFFIVFVVINIYVVIKENRKLRKQKPPVWYKPVPVEKKKKEAVKPAPKPEPKPQYLTVQEFVKKNLNLIDGLLEKEKTFTLSSEILKDLDNKGVEGLSSWFNGMDKVVNATCNRDKFTVFM